MQTCEKAQKILEEMLPESSSFSTFWSTYKDFSKVTLEDDQYEIEGDSFLVEINKYDDSDKSFYFGLVRQFSFRDEDGEYCGMEQLICDLSFDKGTRDLIEERVCLWSDDFGGDTDKLFKTVEAMPFFESGKEDSSFQFSIEATGV